ncbi:hypothetical protein DEO72_LG6g3369 [Vigna unguiculata]|uniref:Uncharacterized protein n=1 Tax=Vigna unguiculata TaxID=3917 RepID=A0A4D6MCD0_VIGUN|nr:hypothetical protein DEO72_LG6g3369 [Vigna unguiculata]
MSIEAMAMAGMDYKECGISLEKWNPLIPQQPPLYLVAVHEELVNLRAEGMKAKIRTWAKAVASTSKQQSVTNHQFKLLVFS